MNIDELKQKKKEILETFGEKNESVLDLSEIKQKIKSIKINRRFFISDFNIYKIIKK